MGKFFKTAGSDLYFVSADKKERMRVPTRYHYIATGKYTSPALNIARKDQHVLSYNKKTKEFNNAYFVKPRHALQHEEAYEAAKGEAMRNVFFKSKNVTIRKKFLGIPYKKTKTVNYTDVNAALEAVKHPDYIKGDKAAKAFMKKHRSKGYFVDVG